MKFSSFGLSVVFGLALINGEALAQNYYVYNDSTCQAAGFSPMKSGSAKYCVLPKNYTLKSGDVLQVDIDSSSPQDYFLSTSAFTVATKSNVTINGTLKLNYYRPTPQGSSYTAYLFVMGSSSGGLRQDTVTVGSGGRIAVYGNIHNRGILTNSGTIETRNAGYLHDVVHNCGSFTNATGGTLDLQDFYDSGKGFFNTGPCVSGATSVFTNNGTITDHAGQIIISPNTSFQNNAAINIPYFQSSGDYAIVNQGGDFVNAANGTITIQVQNHGIYIQSGAAMTNNGTVTNNQTDGVMNCGTWNGNAPSPDSYVTTGCSAKR